MGKIDYRLPLLFESLMTIDRPIGPNQVSRSYNIGRVVTEWDSVFTVEEFKKGELYDGKEEGRCVINLKGGRQYIALVEFEVMLEGWKGYILYKERLNYLVKQN